MQTSTSGAIRLRYRRSRALAAVSLALLPALALTVFASHLLAQTAHASGSLSFATAVSYPVGNDPYTLAVGDLNGDGHPDLVTGTLGSGDISVLLGSSTGVFGAATNYVGDGTGAPFGVAIGDLNGNNKPDLVVADSDGFVSVLLGDGLGGFGVATNYAVGALPESVAIGNFNGHPDVVTANNGSNSVSVLLGNGTGVLGTPTDYPVGVNPTSVAIGNVNGDSAPDLVTANAGSNDVSILFGDGDGTFAQATNEVIGSQPRSVAIGDANGDNNADVVTANYGSNTVSVLPGNGNGTFGALTSYSANGAGAFAVAIGDLDSDGHNDLVITNSGTTFNGTTISVLPGESNGTFGAAVTFTVGTGPSPVVIGDLNGDSKPDVVTANQISNDVSVLLNTTVASSPTPTPTPGGGGSNSAQVTLAIANGELSASTTAAPSLSATITGQDQTVNYSLPINVIDSTGTGAGWNLTITSTQFSTSGAPADTLPTTASTVISSMSACATSSCTDPTNTVAYPFTIPAGVTPPAPVKLFNAAMGTGMGSFTVTPSVNILIPGSTLAGTYTSTISLAIVSGP